MKILKKKESQSFTKGIIILLISQFLVKVMGLAYRLYLTNKEGFGDAGNAIYSSGFQIYTLFLTISSIGVPNAVSKLISEKLSIGDERNAKRIFKLSITFFGLIGFCCSLIMFLGSNFIANRVLQIPETELTLQVLAPSIFFIAIISVLKGYFNATGNMKPMAHSQTIEQLAKTIFSIGIVEYIGKTNNTELMAAGANLATTISAIVSVIYLYNYYRNYKITKIKKEYYETNRILNILKSIAITTIPITLSVVLAGLNKTIDSITVVRGLRRFMSTQEAQIQYGILCGKVDTLINLPMSFNMALNASLIPAISSAKAKKDNINIKRKIKYSLLIVIGISLFYTIIILLFADKILNVLFSNANQGAFILRISSLSIIFIMLNQTINAILQGMGKHFIYVVSIGLGVILKLILNIILVPINPNNFILGGVTGAVFSTIICYVISLSISLIKLKKYRIKNENIENTSI